MQVPTVPRASSRSRSRLILRPRGAAPHLHFRLMAECRRSIRVRVAAEQLAVPDPSSPFASTTLPWRAIYLPLFAGMASSVHRRDRASPWTGAAVTTTCRGRRRGSRTPSPSPGSGGAPRSTGASSTRCSCKFGTGECSFMSCALKKSERIPFLQQQLYLR